MPRTAWIFVIAAAFAPNAFGARPCFMLLTNPKNQPDASGSEYNAARIWLEDHSVYEYPNGYDRFPAFQRYLSERGQDWLSLTETDRAEWATRFVFNQWQRWGTVNERQRDLALSQELDMMANRRSAQSSVIAVSPHARLKALSQANSARMLNQLESTFPLPRPIDPRSRATAQQMVAELNMAFLYSRDVSRESGINPPIVSPRELGKNQLPFSQSFYSQLMDRSPSVGFSLVGFSKRSQAPYLIGEGHDHDAYRLNDEYANAAAFVLPAFPDAKSMISFFQQWDPAALDALVRFNAWDLPSEARTTTAMGDVLGDAEKAAQIFPPDRLFDRMAPLRTRLDQYVMTVPDGTEFLRQAFLHYLLLTAATSPKDFQDLRQEWNVNGGAQYIFTRKFLPFLGWPGGVSVRVPISVAPQNYSILRLRFLHYSIVSRNHTSPGRRIPINGSGAVDHSSAP